MQSKSDRSVDEWIDEGPVRGEAVRAIRRGNAGPRRSASPAERIDVEAAEATRAVGAKDAVKLEVKIKEAARAFRSERYPEARKLLVPLAQRAPSSAAVRELLGLTYYRLGRWKQAIDELESFRELSGSTEQHPVLADCYRALRRWKEVEALWDELCAVSPSSELVTEGRIVMAGSLADRGKLTEAVAMLERGFRLSKNPQEHQLRRAYALADLQERAGDLPQARSMFQRIAGVDPDFGDVEDRLRALR